MFKSFLLKMLKNYIVPAVFDLLIVVAKELSKGSNNLIDDKVVMALEASRTDIINEIKKRL